MKRREARRVAVLATLALTACAGAASPGGASVRLSTASGPPLPATSPYLVTAGGSTGWAVFPSGSAWLLLYTGDGFAHVTNRTPSAVETDGGLVVSVDGNQVAVAVAAHERLVRSPVLTAAGGPDWLPSELPGSVSVARGGVSVRGKRLTAVTTSGDVLEQTASGWQTLTDSNRLAPGGRVTLDSVTWGSASVGWVAGHGPAGQPMAFETFDAGATWAPVAMTSGSAVAALAPCGSASSWVLPVISASGALTVLRTSDDGVRWTPGAALPVAAGEPAWSCDGNQIWMTAHAAGGDHVFSSPDAGRSWSDRGPAPTGLTDLTPTGAGVGYAASGGKHLKLWRVADDGARFAEIALPGWVASVGRQTTGS